MLKEDEILKEDYKEAKITCPECNATKLVKLPKKLIENSENLVTISIPANYICEHGFQAFIDGQFHIRGYQNADFEVTEIEVYETGSKPFEGVITYRVSSIIKNTIDFLRRSRELGDIIGGALFNQQGNVLYISLPNEIFINIIKQFDLQKREQEINIEEMIFVLDSGQKIFTQYFEAEGYKLIVVVLFSSSISIGQGASYLEKIKESLFKCEDPLAIMRKEKMMMKKMEMAKAKKKEVKLPSDFWIYSTVESEHPLEESESVFVGALGIQIDKKNILNFQDIVKQSKNNQFEGKLFFSEKYVSLMQGLSYTMKNASIFMSKLNKK